MLSVIIPVYNEASNLEPLFQRLWPVMVATGDPFEVLCVDDGSKDHSWQKLQHLYGLYPELKAVSLSRNFGKEVALAAGLKLAKGDAVILMDADLQHPPELIPTFIAAWAEGYQMVYGERIDQRHGSSLRAWLRSRFYQLFEWMGEVALPAGAGDFRLIDRQVVDALNLLNERNRFTKGLYAWVGFKQKGIQFQADLRQAGQSGWSLQKLWKFGLDALTGFSNLPLKIWSYLGLVISFFALSYGLYFFVRTILFGIDVPGYPSLIVAIMFFAGVQLISLGVLGEYLGRVFTEVKQRPLYLIADKIGFHEIDGHGAEPK